MHTSAIIHTIMDTSRCVYHHHTASASRSTSRGSELELSVVAHIHTCSSYGPWAQVKFKRTWAWACFHSPYTYIIIVRPVSPSQAREGLSLNLLSHREFTSTTWILRMGRRPKNSGKQRLVTQTKTEGHVPNEKLVNKKTKSNFSPDLWRQGFIRNLVPSTRRSTI